MTIHEQMPLEGRARTPTNHRGSSWAGYGLFAVVIAGLSGLLAWQVVPEILDGQLIETDNYMRLVRVTHLVETRDWYDNSIPRSNAPFGEVLHWTRPLDLVILGAAAPLRPFFDSPDALHLAGVFVPPLLLLLTCYAMAWASVPVAGERIRFYAMITLVAQPAIVSYGLPGRVDHHVLMVLLFTLTLGAVSRWLLAPIRPWLGLLAGTVLGLGLWVGPEFLLPLALTMVTGAVVWVREGADAAAKNQWLVLGLLCATIVAWLLEHPPSGLFVVEYDRISAPHVFLSVLAVGFWTAVGGIERWSANPECAVGRIALMGIGGVAAMGAMLLVFPQFFKGPTVGIDPHIWVIWLDLIEERRSWFPPTGLADVGNLVSHVGAVVFCIPFVGWALRQEWKNPRWAVWLFLGLVLSVFTVLGLVRVRHLPYAETVIVIITVTLLAHGLDRVNSATSPYLRAPARTFLAAALITGPLFLGVTITAFAGQTGADVRNASRTVAAHCPMSRFTSFLLSRELGEQPRTIAAHIDYGPEILYRTPHWVLGTPYHRNSDGILAGFSILGGTDLDEVEIQVRSRGVDLILVCPLHSWIYRGQAQGGGDRISLHDRLLEGQEPPWLERIAIPEGVAGAFRVFRVLPN